MIKIIKSLDRQFNDFGWLKTFWLFSFSNYYDPANLQHGKLRVFNDDTVQPGKGFSTHPHEEMEIITLVLDGEITHKDSMGNQGVIRAGEVQRMSAGTGLTHSEYNTSKTGLAFYQIWILPDKRGLEPSYAQRQFKPEAFKNTVFPVASGQTMPDTVSFHTDATIYRSILDSGKTVEFLTAKDRYLFVYVSSGSIRINNHLLSQKDQARISLESVLTFSAVQTTDFILVDVPEA
ncbi:MAG: pirin family protein [Proteobacteria bacterium]|nr:pirin family protein [Pseudomonadota bacterium]MBU1583387.1 pirin family protein [Pseudomonadota bacterium]MBU2453660.1 pirin family protein [Pseudomonadota bacterium]MBU2629246.1 pirin family protein [Pseudomonadota bacterium]